MSVLKYNVMQISAMIYHTCYDVHIWSIRSKCSIGQKQYVSGCFMNYSIMYCHIWNGTMVDKVLLSEDGKVIKSKVSNKDELKNNFAHDVALHQSH